MKKYLLIAIVAIPLLPLYLLQQNQDDDENPEQQGGFTLKIVEVNGNYEAKMRDSIILVDASAGPVTIILPKANVKGSHICVKKVDKSDNRVTIKCGSGENIEGKESITLSTQWGWCRFVSKGSGCWLLF